MFIEFVLSERENERQLIYMPSVPIRASPQLWLYSDLVRLKRILTSDYVSGQL